MGSPMNHKDMVAVVLAAGKGTRLRSDLAKILHRAGGRPLVEHVVRTCQSLQPAEIVVIVGHQAEAVSAVVTPLSAKPVLQEPQNGTGHAMQVARAAIGSSAKYAIVVPGDAPLIRSETLAALVETHLSGNAAATILTAEMKDPTGYGRIVRGPDGSVAAIVEQKAATPAQREIREINSSAYCFTLEKLWPSLEQLRPENVHRELYLTDAIALLNQRGEKVLAYLAGDAQEVIGCNTRVELADADRIFRQRKAVALMESGVTIYLPETVLIDPDVQVGQDTIIEPGVQLLGDTRIGARCTIRTGSILLNSVLADDVTIEAHSSTEKAVLARNASIGPFARLRPGADLREGAKIGNFVEVKNTVMHEGAKAQHLTYLGDATVGRSANVGAGTITCNYDGVKKNRTVIGERAFIGSDTALVAPVEIGDGAYVAAGSTITENVPPDALAIARGRQSNKAGWAAARRAKREAEKSKESGHGTHGSSTHSASHSHSHSHANHEHSEPSKHSASHEKAPATTK